MLNNLMLVSMISIPLWVWIVAAAIVVVLCGLIPVVLIGMQKASKNTVKKEKAPKAEKPEKKKVEAKTSKKPEPKKPTRPGLATLEQKPSLGSTMTAPGLQSSAAERKAAMQSEVALEGAHPTMAALAAGSEQAAATQGATAGAEKEAVTYNVSKRFVDDKWIITLNDSTKPMRVFDTQQAAVNYATEMATKKNGNVVVHKRSAK